MIRTSVVIPTLNRPGSLAECLAALAVGFPPDAETIVVSDGGTCDLDPVVAPFAERLRLRLLVIGNAGPGGARNRGVEAAHGEVVAFTDDDCRPQPGWLRALVSGVVQLPPRAMGGLTRNGLPENVYADAEQLVLDLVLRYDWGRMRLGRFLPSNNLAFPTEPLRRLGGFDARFRTAEDRELCRRWMAAGFELDRVPAAVVEHDSRVDFGGFVRKFVAYGRGAARFHDSGESLSPRERFGFHFKWPMLLPPELRRRQPGRSAAILALFLVWEAANLFGYVGGRLRGPAALATRMTSNPGEAP